MASRDPAFQWETEVLRSREQRSGRPQASPAHDVVTGSGDWLTVREASEATGVPTSTIRKWARHDNIPSFLEETSSGYLRLVSMDGIERWTTEIGRDIDIDVDDESETQVDLTASEQAVPDDQTVPEGSMIVPLDAWNRMLNQLGNLHEAGQQLAEARERAAKAETEARFLKERLADLREELENTKEVKPPEEPSTAISDDSDLLSPSSIARKIYRGWRSRRRRN